MLSDLERRIRKKKKLVLTSQKTQTSATNFNKHVPNYKLSNYDFYVIKIGLVLMVIAAHLLTYRIYISLHNHSIIFEKN